jgi:hypothetical protein
VRKRSQNEADERHGHKRNQTPVPAQPQRDWLNSVAAVPPSSLCSRIQDRWVASFIRSTSSSSRPVPRAQRAPVHGREPRRQDRRGAVRSHLPLHGMLPALVAGRRFEKGTDGGACGTNSQTTRDVVQRVLLGRSTGQGMIPAETTVHTVVGRGIPDRSRPCGCGMSQGRTPSWGSRPTNRAGGRSKG